MLIAGKIPEKEPTIRVGIILAEDEQTQLSLSSPNPILIQLDNEEAFELNDLTLSIDLFNKKLLANFGNRVCESRNIFLKTKSSKQSINISPVRTGRSFHWEKTINIELSHLIEIKIRKDYLLLINEITLEDYLACVTTSEMNSACPPEFIKTQSIAARSWMLANIEQKHIHLGFDVCNDDCCQRYQGRTNLTENAYNHAYSTKGQVLLFENKICDARYSKSCGGISEKFSNLWEDTDIAYLRNNFDGPVNEKVNLKNEKDFEEWIKNTPEAFCGPKYIEETALHLYLGNVDEEGKYFRWTKHISQENLLRNINKKTAIQAEQIIAMKVIERGESGRILKLEIEYLDKDKNIQKHYLYKDYEVRKVLHPDFLYSSAIIINKIAKKTGGPDFLYLGCGWGHGAGLCQIGALAMSLEGYSSEQILSHYYPGTKLTKIY